MHSKKPGGWWEIVKKKRETRGGSVRQPRQEKGSGDYGLAPCCRSEEKGRVIQDGQNVGLIGVLEPKKSTSNCDSGLKGK